MPKPIKPMHLRQRRNKTTTRATLPDQSETDGNDVPKMPKREARTGPWHPEARSWWHDVWTSPMSTQHVFSDRHGLRVLVALVHDFWTAADSKERMNLATAIGREGARFGLSPLDRSRLQWEIDRGEAAADKTKRRRNQKRTPAETGEDPRESIKVVS